MSHLVLSLLLVNLVRLIVADCINFYAHNQVLMTNGTSTQLLEVNQTSIVVENY